MSQKNKPNFAKSYKNANEILVKSSVITSFPYSSIDLVKEQSAIKCCSFGKAMSYGFNPNDLGSESAIITEYHGKSIIFYNEEKPNSHINFSVLHELGHPINDHDLRISDKNEYHKFEVEANYFAAQLLMPEQLLRELQKRGVFISKDFLKKTFGVSSPAAEKRIATIDKTNFGWYSKAEKEYDDIILQKYSSFLDSIKPVSQILDYENECEKQLIRNSWF